MAEKLKAYEIVNAKAAMRWLAEHPQVYRWNKKWHRGEIEKMSLFDACIVEPYRSEAYVPALAKFRLQGASRDERNRFMLSVEDFTEIIRKVADYYEQHTENNQPR